MSIIAPPEDLQIHYSVRRIPIDPALFEPINAKAFDVADVIPVGIMSKAQRTTWWFYHGHDFKGAVGEFYMWMMAELGSDS